MGCGRNVTDAERQSGRGDGEHDLSLAQLPDNVDVMNTAKSLLQKVLQLARKSEP